MFFGLADLQHCSHGLWKFDCRSTKHIVPPMGSFAGARGTLESWEIGARNLRPSILPGKGKGKKLPHSHTDFVIKYSKHSTWSFL